MPGYDQKQVDAAVARLPRLSSAEVRDLRARAEKADLRFLIAACDAEVGGTAVRFGARPLQFRVRRDGPAGDRHVPGRCDPPRIWENGARPRLRGPGASLHRGQSWLSPSWRQSLWQRPHRRKGDLQPGDPEPGLVYDRYGCFRKFIEPGQDQSSVLLDKDRSGRSVRYRLKPEAELVFRELAIID